jgi:hypothetical protein
VWLGGGTQDTALTRGDVHGAREAVRRAHRSHEVAGQQLVRQRLAQRGVRDPAKAMHDAACTVQRYWRGFWARRVLRLGGFRAVVLVDTRGRRADLSEVWG